MGFTVPDQLPQSVPAQEHRIPHDQPGRKHPFGVPTSAHPFKEDGRGEKIVTPPPPPAIAERTFGKTDVIAVMPLPGILLKQPNPNESDYVDSTRRSARGRINGTIQHPREGEEPTLAQRLKKEAQIATSRYKNGEIKGSIMDDPQIRTCVSILEEHLLSNTKRVRNGTGEVEEVPRWQEQLQELREVTKELEKQIVGSTAYEEAEDSGEPKTLEEKAQKLKKYSELVARFFKIINNISFDDTQPPPRKHPHRNKFLPQQQRERGKTVDAEVLLKEIGRVSEKDGYTLLNDPEIGRLEAEEDLAEEIGLGIEKMIIERLEEEEDDLANRYAEVFEKYEATDDPDEKKYYLAELSHLLKEQKKVVEKIGETLVQLRGITDDPEIVRAFDGKTPPKLLSEIEAEWDENFDQLIREEALTALKEKGILVDSSLPNMCVEDHARVQDEIDSTEKEKGEMLAELSEQGVNLDPNTPADDVWAYYKLQQRLDARRKPPIPARKVEEMKAYLERSGVRFGNNVPAETIAQHYEVWTSRG